MQASGMVNLEEIRAAAERFVESKYTVHVDHLSQLLRQADADDQQTDSAVSCMWPSYAGPVRSVDMCMLCNEDPSTQELIIRQILLPAKGLIKAWGCI